MGYSKLRMKKGKKITLEDKVIYLLKKRLEAFEEEKVKTKGMGTYLIQKVLSKNNNTVYYNDLVLILDDLIDDMTVNYDKCHFYYITEKGLKKIELNNSYKNTKLKQAVKSIY